VKVGVVAQMDEEDKNMIESKELQNLRANQRFLAIELMSRGIDVSVFDWTNEVLEARCEGRHELFLDIDNSNMPYAASMISGSKPLTKNLLKRAGISVPVGQHFAISDKDAIKAFVLNFLTFPVVIKPSVGNQGLGVHTGLESLEEISYALQCIEETHGKIEVLVEEQFHAAEYRIFITRAGDCAILHRDPAHVIGDGIHTIQELAVSESERRLNPRVNCLCEIKLDYEAERYLRKQGLTVQSIPSHGEKIYVRGSSNVMMGGVPEDYTDRVHPSAVSLAWKALLAIPGLPYAGIDFMSTDITTVQTSSSYRILEINSVPGIGIHMSPGRGKPRNVAAMLVDLIFPESIKRMAA
jgi:cyanophycin synthetase